MRNRTMQPRTNQRNAARAILLPLDCTTETLERLFAAEPEATLSSKRGFNEYLRAALTQHDITPAPPAGATEISELATFAALAALRIHHADPLKGTEYEDREPPGSAESRMLRTPLAKHPGLTNFCIRARNYYIATITWLFEHEFPPELQAEIAAVLLARDPPGTSNQAPYRTYANTDPETVHHQFRDRTNVTDDLVWIDIDQISRCCQLLPCISKFISSSIDSLSRLCIGNGGLNMPKKLFRLKLAEYAWHGWARLVHIAHNTLAVHARKQLVDGTPSVQNHIFSRFRRNNPIYAPYYASNSKNPQREWRQKTTTTKPIQIEDKRLITVVDCIRASPLLSFGTPLPVERLFDYLKAYFPPPRRPGNDIGSRNTLIKALANAKSNRVKLYHADETSNLVCKIPAPKDTPIYPPDEPNFWDRYLRLQSKQRDATVNRKWINDADGYRQVVEPVLPQQAWQTLNPNYELAVNHAQRAAAQAQSTVPSLHDVEPVRDVGSALALTDDELIFLTRIGLAMERKIADFSLTNSMRALRYRADGTKLKVDEDKLKDLDWLEVHKEGLSVLYTVPAPKRKLLGIENSSHDGYGEKTTKEKSVHRKAIDLCAAAFATKPDVTRVVRYHDLWRLRSTACEPVLEQNDLLSTRVDVIAFNSGTPKYVAEVETMSNEPSRSHQCVKKLAAFSEIDGIRTSLVAPNPDHLWEIMKHLDHPNYFDFDSFPDSTSDNYGRSEWDTKLDNEGIFGQYFDQLDTYRSLAHKTPDSESDSYDYKIVGNS
ncbi:hypothetical protein [Halobacteriaceae bacterium SHR40]|uniref:hypothetical protein n=1 Tax=Halovenus amylolytica TaxID=2500550 RepID=UPI000FE2DE21